MASISICRNLSVFVFLDYYLLSIREKKKKVLSLLLSNFTPDFTFSVLFWLLPFIPCSYRAASETLALASPMSPTAEKGAVALKAM